ncbi:MULTISPECIES: SMR family transporter [Bosea]|uniref:SMR family transporter n=1 Tax=Bosea TaxID=85413 RepID=UPI002150120F|nr:MULTISPECIES: SMR family transporter [Bosea]MCR4520468.1 SMR family transporter [Bosea sp. 47.2.35]MDR6827821.1 spermidine export protein MdtI [Bosea robiniae]MDR6894485.1 spermidine export protein MdtI [Bosea sp. BE109]MDR7137927.1 spermidine export protein MdtI [Bosea sp. BE168]MDR7174626.1 spermidine export protein MdtI [Bosea sp. BE271]
MTASFVQAAPFLWLLLAVALEIGGTYLLKLSDGMTRRTMGAGGIVLVMGAFAALAKAIEGMDLSVAYAVWGGAGLVITAIIGALVFGQRIRPVGWLGIVLVVCGVVALKMV